jgi:hypothetical protein
MEFIWRDCLHQAGNSASIKFHVLESTILRYLRIIQHGAGLAGPLSVELLDRAADAEAPGELAKSFVLFGNDVSLGGFFHGHAGLATMPVRRNRGLVIQYSDSLRDLSAAPAPSRAPTLPDCIVRSLSVVSACLTIP